MAAADIIRRLLPYSTVALILAAGYTGRVMFTRYSNARQAERRIEDQTRERQIEAGKQIDRQFGGDRLKILNFSADTGVTHPGGRVLLCYGVANAAAVKIEPEVEPIKPAVTRCVEVFPKKTRTYTLTASDNQGHTESASLMIMVH